MKKRWLIHTTGGRAGFDYGWDGRTPIRVKVTYAVNPPKGEYGSWGLAPRHTDSPHFRKWYKESDRTLYGSQAQIIKQLDDIAAGKTSKRLTATSPETWFGEGGAATTINPLRSGYSRATVSANIAREVKASRAQDQAVAMSLRSARKAWKARHPGKPYPAHLKTKRSTPKANPKPTAVLLTPFKRSERYHVEIEDKDGRWIAAGRYAKDSAAKENARFLAKTSRRRVRVVDTKK